MRCGISVAKTEQVEQLLLGMHPELLVDVLGMGSHGVLGDEQRLGDVGFGTPLHEGHRVLQLGT